MRGWHGAIVVLWASVAVLATGTSASATARPAWGNQPAIWTVAGTGQPCRNPPFCGDGGVASTATLAYPDGVDFDRAGNLYVADRTDDEVRTVSTGVAQTITRLAGNGLPCDNPPACGDGGP